MKGQFHVQATLTPAWVYCVDGWTLTAILDMMLLISNTVPGTESDLCTFGDVAIILKQLHVMCLTLSELTGWTAQSLRPSLTDQSTWEYPVTLPLIANTKDQMHNLHLQQTLISSLYKCYLYRSRSVSLYSLHDRKSRRTWTPPGGG